MTSKIIPVKIERTATTYDINIGSGLLDSCGKCASAMLQSATRRIVIVSNKKVFGLYGTAVADRLSHAGFEVTTYLIGDGERFKSFRTLDAVLTFLGSSRLSRTDSVVALGGGVVGDIAGFASSMYLRGIPFIQIPTTLLAMLDSSVGGKTGVNSKFGKNSIGSFYQPSGVLIDPLVLKTLPKRELTAGFCEAVKLAAIAGGELFDETAAFLEEEPVGRFANRVCQKKFTDRLADLLAAHVAFKAEIVRGDELESPDKTGPHSRKILNFGHTFAHALERATNYRYLKHGEAVGHGIRFATELSKKLELLSKSDVELLNDVVHRAGRLPDIGHIDGSEIFNSLIFDKKTVGDNVQWILLEGIGRPVGVSGAKIPQSILNEVFKKITHY